MTAKHPKLAATLAMSGALVGNPAASAQTIDEEESYRAWLAERDAPTDTPARVVGSAVHVDIVVDLVSGYFYRGLYQERDEIITQNSVEVGFDVLEPEDAEIGLTAIFGIWNSFHEAATDAVSTDEFVEHWYESDLYIGLMGSRGDWSFGAIYYVYTSPSDAFSTDEDITLSLTYDDGKRWNKDISFSPTITLAVETRGAADGIDAGIYLGFGLTPTLDAELFSRQVELSFPLTLGLSLDDYYQNASGDDDTFGFFDIGAEFSTDLSVDERLGRWSLSGGLHWLVLGENTQILNRGRDNQLYARLGISISF